MIHVYNYNEVDYSMMPNNYYMGEQSIFENPFGYCRGARKDVRTMLFKTKKDMLDAYGGYFDKMYEADDTFKNTIDEIYEKYKNGEEIYFQCTYKSSPCYGDVIANKLQAKLLKERQEISRKMKLQK